MRKDSDNLAILERLKPQHAAEMNKKIRLEAELERGERDLEEYLTQLEQTFGTRDLNVVRTKITENYQMNTEVVDAFQSALENVRGKMAALENK